MSELRTFSESWHRIANVKVSLRPTVHAERQRFRGEDWYVLSDPFTNKFYRVRPESYRFLARLDGRLTVTEAWDRSMTEDPDGSPGQDELLHLLTQLHLANLLYFSTPSDADEFYARHERQRERELRAKIVSIMFLRIPLLDPDDALKRLSPYFAPIFSRIGFLVWLGVVTAALFLCIDNVDALVSQAEGVLAPDNLLWLYVGMVLIKTIHEFGHAVICRHYGGEVHVMGVMFIVFTPLPYLDATSSWAFRNRWHRALVGAGGMLSELFVAAIAVFVWANTGEGALHSFAYNMMFVASVSTILFNANPLLRFDGYYILSDAVDIPNLYTRAQKQLQYLFERYAFGCFGRETPAESTKEAWWLGIYGVLSIVYRLIVFVGIILFVGDMYLILGLMMVVVLVIMWLVRPPYMLVKYLATSPVLNRVRGRAVMATAAMLAAVVFLFGMISFPDRFRAPGVLVADEYQEVVSESSGYVTEVVSTPGSFVQAGEPLLRMENLELENRLETVQAQWRQVINQERLAMREVTADLAPIEERKKSIRARFDRLLAEYEALVIHAPRSGIWVAPGVGQLAGSYLPRGSRLGELVNPATFYFSAVIPQDEASDLFNREISLAEVRLYGRESTDIEVTSQKIIPFEQAVLPSAALGWRGGGAIQVDVSDPAGRKAVEPFFRIDAQLSPPDDYALYHGASGLIRFTLEPKPLFFQWERDLRQLIQRRYQI